jgi:hypothetical protein
LICLQGKGYPLINDLIPFAVQYLGQLHTSTKNK